MNRHGSAGARTPRNQHRAHGALTGLTAALALGLGLSTAAGAAELRFDEGFPNVVDEGDGTINLGLELVATSQGATGECEVAGDLIATGGSATAGSDYTLGTFTVPVTEQGFAQGDVVGSGSGPITIRDDDEIEPDETASLDMSVTSNSCTEEDLATITTTGATLTIVDNDDTAGPEAPASVEVSGRAGTTATSEFTVSDDTPPLNVSTDIGSVSPETIDDTSGTVTFTFDVPQGTEPGQTFTGTITITDGSPDENTTSVPVTVTAGTVIDTTGLTPTQRSVANAIGGACDRVAALEPGSRTGGQEDLLSTCDRLQGTATPGAILDQVAQEELFAQGRLGTGTARDQLANVDARLTRVRSGAIGFSLAGLNLTLNGQQLPPGLLAAAVDGVVGGGATDDSAGFGRWGAYLNGSITRGERDGTSRENGYDADSWSLTAGTDYRITDRFVLGGSLGYNRSDTSLDGDSGDIDVDGYTASLYASFFRPEGYYLDAVVSYGRNSYDTKRHVDLGDGGFNAKGDPDGRQYTVSVDGGYDLSRGPWTIGFQGVVVYTDVRVDSYDEDASRPGADGAGTVLHIGRQDVDSLTTELATQVTYAISTNVGVFLPTARLGWEHEFRDDQRAIEAHFLNDPASSTFRIRSDDPDRNFFNAGAGVSAQFPQGRSAFVFVESVLDRDHVTEYSVDAGLRLEF